MFWLMLLIQLLPSIVSIIRIILDLIKKQPTLQARREARAELYALARYHVRKRHDTKEYYLGYGADAVTADFEGLRAGLEVKANA